MRVRDFPRFSDPPKEWDAEWFQETLVSLEEALTEQARAINGGLGFGDETDFDNLMGKWLAYATNAVANTEDELTHNLGAVPIGFIVMTPPATGVVNRGTTSWTTSKLYLKCSGAAQTAVIFVLAPSHGITV